MQGNAVLAVIAGIVSALVGAVIWAVVTVATGYQIGWRAVGVGFLVGIAVMVAGQGEGGLFGTIGAVCALLGCVLGNLFTGIGMVANAEGLGYIETLTGTFGVWMEILSATFSPMDILFYGIAVWEGFRFGSGGGGE